jgi:predicted regulator of Ras-like GTPase activity (Roadblock/LC7/MglB family)
MHCERNPRVESELERLRKKVENFPSASAYNRLAELIRLNGDVPGAEQICRRCIKEFPRNGQAYVILAEIEFSDGRKNEAIQDLRSAVEHDTRSYAAHRMLADVHAETGALPQALQHLRHILTFKANDPAVLQRIEQLSQRSKGAVSGRNKVVPAGAVATSTPASGVTATVKTDGFAALCAEPGVRGALIADHQGRVVSSSKLTPEQEGMLAALSAEIAKAGQTALASIGQERLTTWTVSAAQGQVLAFKRDQSFNVVILAESGVRPAMLEIRARQTFFDLGAG